MTGEPGPILKKHRTTGWVLMAFGMLWVIAVVLLTPGTNSPQPMLPFAFLLSLLFFVPGFALVAEDRCAKWWVKVGLLVFSVAYLAGYIGLSRSFDTNDISVRDYPARWICRVYWPLGWCECKLDQKAVLLRWPLSSSQDGKHGVVIRP